MTKAKPAAADNRTTSKGGARHATSRTNPATIMAKSAGLCTALVLWLLVDRTEFGIRLRAAVDNGDMAEALGIKTQIIFSLTFALAVGLAAFGGVQHGINVLTSDDPALPAGGAVFHDTSVWMRALALIMT